MHAHGFIFTPGIWIGEGKITFSASPEFIKFYTRWQINQDMPGKINAVQTVEMQGIPEHVINVLTFSDITPTTFSVVLENELMGKVEGSGLINAKTIAWEFRQQEAFEGFEVYEIQENGDYLLHAEYSSTDQFRTIIDALIWKKS